MATITTVMLQAVNQKEYVGAITPLYHSFDVTNLAAAVTNGDRILIATLPANARIIGASIRQTTAQSTTGIQYLSVVEPTGNIIALSSTTMEASLAGKAVMSQPHSPIISVTATRSINIEVTTGSIGATTAGAKYIVTCDWAFHP